MRSQDLPPAHAINGAYYLIAPGDLRSMRSFFSEAMVPLVMDEAQESLDIDTAWDWKMAEGLLAMRGTTPK